jgi:C4-dicarboxylate-specific signal transduction histidine kinase
MPNAVHETTTTEQIAYDSESRRHETPTEFAHANRLAILGQLSASIAHEVIQPIGATVTAAEAALRWLGHQPPDLEETRQLLAQIVRDGKRAGDVVHRIRALMKKEPSRGERLDINKVIREAIELTRGEAVRRAVSVQMTLAEHLPLIEGDQIQLQQVMLNLIINAFEAMSPQSSASRDLTIVSAKAEPDGVLVAVRDSGPGVDPANLERVFDAFFSTKADGSGMGLTICRTIIQAHGGHMSATRGATRGAILQFTLPAVTESIT